MSDVLKIQVKALRWFAENNCGGIENVRDMTTYDVVESFIRPFVRRQEKCPPDGTSLAFLVWSEGLSSYGQSGPYIIHTWGASFIELIETLEEGLGLEEYMWLDILCMNQVGSTPPDAHFFANDFYSTVRECEAVAMVCDACAERQDMGNSVHRLWCLLEIWASVQTKASFTMLVTSSSLETIRKDPEQWARTFLHKPIGFEYSKCTDKHDHRVITLQIGDQTEAFNLWVELKIRGGLQNVLEEIGAPLADWKPKMETLGTRRTSSVVPPVAILESDLQKACKLGNTPEVTALLERGANLNGKDSDANTALHIASYNGHTPVVVLLIEKGADVQIKNHQGNTALHAAAFNGHAATAQKLVEAKAPIEARNDQGDTPLHVAAQRGHYHAAGILLACGAPVNAQDDWGATPLDLAKANEGSKNTKSVQDLLKTHGGVSGPKGCRCSIA